MERELSQFYTLSEVATSVRRSMSSIYRDIDTCFSGALAVKHTDKSIKLYNAKDLLFRDDLAGSRAMTAYAVINFPGHYVRILRGTNLPLGDVRFSLGDYLAALFEAQDATLVETPEEAEVRVCVGRSDDPTVVSLFDEGFYLG